MKITWIEFGSYLTYSPKCNSDLAKASRTAMKALKDDEVLPNLQIPTSEFLANSIGDNLGKLPSPIYLRQIPS